MQLKYDHIDLGITEKEYETLIIDKLKENGLNDFNFKSKLDDLTFFLGLGSGFHVLGFIIMFISTGPPVNASNDFYCYILTMVGFFIISAISQFYFIKYKLKCMEFKNELNNLLSDLMNEKKTI